MLLRLVATGRADPATAWQRYVDLDAWPSWSPQVQRAEAPSRTLATGLAGEVVGPLGLRVPFRVTEVGARSWTWEVRPLGVLLVLHHEVAPDPKGSRTTLVLDGPAPLVLPYVPLALRALGRLVR